MDIDLATARYRSTHCAAFMRSRERYGKLSNMTGGFPLTVNSLGFQSPEGLYQALKFPTRPDVQNAIAKASSGMEAKRTAYRPGNPPIHPRWDSLRVQAMVYTISLKLLQHPTVFGHALRETNDLPIVEKSYRDPFWGAAPKGNELVGVNTLGKILTQARDLLLISAGDPAQAVKAMMTALPIDELIINGQTVPA